MAKERLFFIFSFAFLGLVAALLFRHHSDDKPAIVAQAPPANADEKPKEPEKPKEEKPAITLTPGKLAVPFQLANRPHIAQFLTTGNYVDVIFTSKPDVDFGTVSLTLFKNLRILAIGKDSEGYLPSQQNAFRSNSPVELLLEMTLRESEIFEYAVQAGTISLVITDNSLPQENSPLIETLLKSESSENFNSTLVTHLLSKLFPKAEIKVIATSKGYILEGVIPETAMMEKIMKILQMLSGDKAVVNLSQEVAETTLVLVAETDLKAGSHITTKDYAWAKIPTDKLNPSLIVKNSQSEKWISESILAKDISKGQEINVCDIMWPTEYLNLKDIQTQLPSLKGILAVPMLLPARALIIQLLSPGIAVDIKFTSKLEIGLGIESLILLKDISVLSIRDTQGKAFNGKSSFFLANPSVEVFLGMTRRQAEVFSYAIQSGEVSLQIAEHRSLDPNQELIDQLWQSESAFHFQSVLITQMISTLFPHVDVKVTVSPKGFIVEGDVPDPQMAKKIVEVLAKMVPLGEQGLINMLHVEPQQVQICIKVFEVERGFMERLGLNWEAILNNNGATALFQAFYPSPSPTDPNYLFNAFGIKWGKVTVSTLINMLEEDANGRVLAEPNLTTISGETAHFFAGGEFPILIPQGGSLLGTVTVEFKKYGVLVDFTPIVELNGLITMHVVPEVSNLDKANSVILNGFVIPALLNRRIDTTVKLWPGQTYLIAGMFLDEWTRTDDSLYGLSKVPIIGPLFSSAQQQQNQTELVILVTPYLITNEDVCECPCPSEDDCE